ncbi:MAG: hypothetical protein LBL07_05485, partial [Tannerella sp.]|nr:hypothetical protein [Tannerella sp.]
KRIKIMLQTVSLDARTLLIKAEHEKELSWIYDYLNTQNRKKIIEDFLDFAEKKHPVDDFKFNRDECYDR